jgi:hypothetical protein
MAAEFEIVSVTDQIRQHIERQILGRLVQGDAIADVFSRLLLFLDSKKISYPLPENIVIGPDSAKRSFETSLQYDLVWEKFKTLALSYNNGKMTIPEVAVRLEKFLSESKISFPLSDDSLFEDLRPKFINMWARSCGRHLDEPLSVDTFFVLTMRMVTDRLSDLKGERPQ